MAGGSNPRVGSRMAESEADALDNSRLADLLDDSPERIHSDPLPTLKSFPGASDSADMPQTATSLPQIKDYQGAVYDTNHEASNRTSMSHWDPEPGFAHIDGEIGGSGYNETTVDVVTVPCPGADPVETWMRDPLPDSFFGDPIENELTTQPTIKELAGDAILTPGIGGHFPKAGILWVRQGIRRFANTARVMLYRHRELTDSTSIYGMAKDLLDSVLSRRAGQQKARPLFFIAHSVGGLVVKQALIIASKDDRYREVLYNCHGMSFFATPHRGSSYISMSNLSESIQQLLHLHTPLPRALSDELRVGNKGLLKMHEEFTDLASEIRIWSFYETIDSLLSGSGSVEAGEVQFSAPLVSIKSAIIGVRHEVIYSSLESDHAHCASFGITNPRTLGTYLLDLAAAISKAETLSQTKHTPLKLKEKVKVEVIGFYEDPDAISKSVESDMRLYITKYHLHDFLAKGPERCLEERLRRVPQRPGLVHPKPPSVVGQRSLASTGLNIIGNVQEFWRTTVSRSQQRSRPSSPNPDIVVNPPPGRLAVSGGDMSVRPLQRPHSLTLPALSTPGFRRPSSRSSNGTTSTRSDPAGQEVEVSPKERVSHMPQDAERGSGYGADETHPRLSSGNRDNTTSKTFALQDLTAGFSRPDPEQRKFMWIHLPFTNPLWVKDIFDKLSETRSSGFGKLFNNENWVSRHVQGRHSQSQSSFLKPAVGHISAADAPASPRVSPSLGNPPTSPGCVYLYLPYLHFDTYRHIIRRRNIITRRLAHGRARPVPKDIANLESLELRVVWEYLGYEPPLNCRRTLDQFGYPSLKDTYARDDDQMLYKLTKENKLRPSPTSLAAGIPSMSLSERFSIGTKLLHEVIEKEKEATATTDFENEVSSDLRDGNLLMVDQLWLWAIDTKTLTTFFPKRESRPSEGALFQQADLRNSIYNELNGDLTGRCENALDLAAFVVLHAVTVLLDRSSHPDLEVFRIFEEAISLLTERMTSNLKRFRMQTFRDFEGDSEDELEDSTAASIKKRHKREIERAERENRENTSALLELRDMEDELRTLGKLFDTQTTMINQMLDIYSGEDFKDLTHNGRGYLQEALRRLVEYKTQTVEMLDRVGATRGDYEKMFEMAQRQAQVDDVRWSRLQTELASSQNLSVMIFTIFTVIFLPLSFFTSLFGMNTLEWGGEGNEYPTISYIGKISLPLSAFMILATLVLAFSSHVQIAFKGLFRWCMNIMLVVFEWVKKLEPVTSRTAKEKRRADKEREINAWRERRRREREYDFWATVKRQRTTGDYEIPGVNKMGDLAFGRSGTGFDSTGGGVGSKVVGRIARRVVRTEV